MEGAWPCCSFLPPPGGHHLPTGETVGEGITTHVPLSSRFPLGQVQTGPLGLSRQSHSHFFLSQGLVTARERGGASGRRERRVGGTWPGTPRPSQRS